MEPDVQSLKAIMRLAHSRLPKEPCGGCEIVRGIWRQDRNIPEIIEHARFRNPYGETTDGAWYAWTWTKSVKKTYMRTMQMGKGRAW